MKDCRKSKISTIQRINKRLKSHWQIGFIHQARKVVFSLARFQKNSIKYRVRQKPISSRSTAKDSNQLVNGHLKTQLTYARWTKTNFKHQSSLKQCADQWIWEKKAIILKHLPMKRYKSAMRSRICFVISLIIQRTFPLRTPCKRKNLWKQK